jgi:drug/metabolite transporter (DMT)-like permease
MLSTVGAVLLLSEAPNSQALLGLLAVVAGIGLIATQGNFAAFRKPDSQTGVRWGTATGGLIAAYTVVDAYGVKQLGIAPVVLDWFANLLRFCLLAPLVIVNPNRARAKMKGFWLLALGVGLLSPLSYIFVLAALDLGAPLSIVAPMREMSMMVGAVMGMVILREKVGPWRLVGCAVLVLGVVLLSSS